MGLDNLDDEPTPRGHERSDSGRYRIVEVERKSMIATGLGWKLGGPLIGAIVMGGAAILWDGFREKVTEGKASEAVVQDIKRDNDDAHKVISDKLNRVDSRTKRDSKITRAIARKLKIELPPEPSPNEE